MPEQTATPVAPPQESDAAAVVGVGGLGAPAALALARVGATLTLIDPDVVELSNLPRQPLYGVGDVGRAKVSVAADRLRATSDCRIRSVVARVDAASAPALLAGHAVVIDGTDGLESKDLLNRTAVALGIPLIHAGAIGLDGQLMTILPRRTACLRCLFPELPSEDELPTCQQAGVLGPVVGAVGFAAAREATAILAGEPAPLAGRLAILDGRQMRWRALEVNRSPGCPHCGSAAQRPEPPGCTGAGGAR